MDHDDPVIDQRRVVELFLERVRVALVPLDLVRATEGRLFWAAVFFAACCVSAGAAIALAASGFANRAVIYLLTGYGGFLLVVCLAFVVTGLRARRAAFSAAVELNRLFNHRTQRAGERPPASAATGDHWNEVLRQLRQTLEHGVFVESDVLPLEEFKARIHAVLSPEDAPEFMDRLYRHGIVEIDTSAPEHPRVKFNKTGGTLHPAARS